MPQLGEPQDDLARIKELITRGAGMNEFLALLTPDARQGHLHRLALLRRFDAAGAAVATGLEPDAVEEELRLLLADQQIVESSSEHGVFGLAPIYRRPAGDWWGVVAIHGGGEWLGEAEKVAEVRALHQRMATHFESAGERWLPELLHHLCVSDPARAMRLLVEKLDDCFPRPELDGPGAVPAVHPKAQDGIALPAAIDLLGVIEVQKEYLPPAEKKIYLDQNGRREAWTAACREWFRSRRYIPRKGIEAWFREQRSQDGKPFLFLHAPGGSGKTMALRWLITHHCLPRGEPVAHLDFDDYLGGGSFSAWQLLLRCAEQLNRQLPGRPLESLLKRMAPVETSCLELQKEGKTEDALPVIVQETITLFPTALGMGLSEIRDRTVTIIVDTLEEPMVRGEVTDVIDFIVALVNLAREAPHIRVILCGRYPLSHHGFEGKLQLGSWVGGWEFYERNVRRERLPRFDREETATYLRARNLALSESQLDRLFLNASEEIESGGELRRECSPFILSLFAATVEAEPAELEELISHPEQLNVVYLCERVISRLPDVALRWVIRYGVVPRVLTRRFLEEVVLTHLQKVHNGLSELDNPSSDKLPERMRERQFFFKADALLEKEAAAALWEKLGVFAAKDSWIEPTEPEGYRFRPEVRNPMLELLGESPVLSEIHRAAAVFYEREAAAAIPAAISSATQQYLYHMRQWDPDGDLERLGQQVEGFFAEENFEAVLSVSREYLEDDGKPPAFSRGIAELRVLAALALCDIAPAGAKTLSRAVAVGALKDLELLVPNPFKRDHRYLLFAALFDARLPLGAEQAEALELLQASGDQEPRIRPWIDLSIALSLETMSSRDCTGIYARLLESRIAAGRPAWSDLSVCMARALASSVHYLGGDGAAVRLLGQLKTSLTAIRDALPDEKYLDLLTVFGSLLEAFSRPDAACRLIEGPGRPTSEPLTPALLALCACGAGRSFPAAGLQQYRRIGENLDSSADISQLSHAMLGEAWTLASVGDLDAAEGVLKRALRMVSRESPVHASRIHLVLAEHHLHETGKLVAARLALQDYERTRGNSDSWAMDGLRARLLELELRQLADGEAVTAAAAEEVLAAVNSSDFWYDRLRVALSLIRLLDEQTLESVGRKIAMLLIGTLEKLPDPIARSKFSELIARRKLPLPFPGNFREQMIGYFAAPEVPDDVLGDPADPHDAAWGALGRAQWLFLLGETEISRELCSVATRHFRLTGSITGLRRAFFFNSLAGWERIDPFSKELGTINDTSSIIRAMIAVEQGELAFEQGRIEDANAWAETALPEFLDGQLTNYSPRASELRAKLSASQEQKLHLWKRAALQYEGLGDIQNLLRVRHHIEELDGHVAVMEDPALFLPPPALAIEIKDEDPAFRTIAPYYLGLEKGVERTVSRVVDTFAGFLKGTKSEHSPVTLSSAIGRILRPIGVIAETPDLCLNLGNDGLAALPWEALQIRWSPAPGKAILYRSINHSERCRIRWVQMALNRHHDASLRENGLLGPGTWEALAAAGGPPRVLQGLTTNKRQLSAAILGQYDRKQPWSSQSPTFSAKVEKLYNSLGIECQIMEGVDLDGLALEWDSSSPPDIVHIYSSYIDAHSTGMIAAPDFGPERRPSKQRTSRPWEYGPALLILDGPAAPGLEEQLRQLCLRNAYAGALAARGEIPHILALGMEASSDFEKYQRLLQGIRDREPVRALYQEWTAGLEGARLPLTPKSLQSHSGTLAAALWTADPDLRAIP